ncbi:MAG: metallophosphoesterase [Clostridia bacterium]|nr:metallophosphoesterase [Clostridia bacterium]MBQ9946537.1 metallophosphoesterase [Clostridia bacterium]
MKSLKRTLALLLSLMLILTGSLSSSAAFDDFSLTKEEWQAVYDKSITDNTLPMLCVGANETELNICWHADKQTAVPQVLLSKNADMSDAVSFTGDLTPAENEEQLVCRVTLTGIDENTVYYYKWYTDSGWSDAYKYESNSFDSFKMLLIGDIQIGGQSYDNTEEQARVGYVWQSVLSEALTKNPDISFLLSPGDNTSTGEAADEWQTLLMPGYVRSLPMALAIGNHDKKGMMYDYYTHMPNEFFGEYFEGLDRDFWFRYGDVLYLVFDACSGSAADHRAMAEEAIALNGDAKWRVGVMHQGLYAPGIAMLEPETNILLNAVFQPIFEMYDLDIVFTGHTHMQGRSNFISDSVVVGMAESGKTYTDPCGIIYLNTNACCDQGNAGYLFPYTAYAFENADITTYSTVEFTETKMSVKTFRGDNSELLDSISIEKTKGFSDNKVSVFFRTALYRLVELLGLIYMRIDAVVVAIRGGHF